ncbi:MAG: LacI family DNA-binding transcriptional regulator [Candidatus Omnitrophica bacterium]|nr:LacI family DNA-binding transcriptional regulator [Candidatus Omnitrophota bacterium]
MAKKKVSIEDVAKRAKVSITTVSRVLNNVPTVSPKNRAKVEEAIAYYKFKPNVSAQRLARGVNNAIGLVMPGYPGIFHSFYAIELIRGVGHACESLRLDMVFHITNGYNPLNTNTVGGVIFADIIENRKQVEQAIATGTPCAIVNNEVHELDVDYIAVNNFSGGEQIADYLVSLGHKRIAVISGNLNTQAGKQRHEGFLAYFKEKGIAFSDAYIKEGDYSRRSAREASEKLLSLEDRPTAIFAASDDMALEVIAVAIEKGLKIPQDLSVVGFDDNPACLYGPIGLTTIRQPLFEMADEAVHHISDLITGKSTKKIQKMLIPNLVIRESCAPPSS